MRILDLYCGAGGAGEGYRQAGLEVVGVDLNPQPRYRPGPFIQANVLRLDPRFLASFDAIHASPPCQAHTAMKTMPDAKLHLDLIAPTRAAEEHQGEPAAGVLNPRNLGQAQLAAIEIDRSIQVFHPDHGVQVLQGGISSWRVATLVSALR